MSKSTGRRFGGFGLDRMLADYEVVADDTAAAEAAPEIEAGAEPEAAEAQPEASAPAFTPEQFAALREMPEFQEFVAGEAYQMTQAQLAEYQQQQPGGEDDQQAAEFDPFDEASVRRVMREELQAMNAPAQQAADQERVNEAVLAEIGRHAEIPSDLAPTLADPIRRLAESFFPETHAMYGATQRAADAAIVKATVVFKDALVAATKAGATQEQTTLANIATATRELPGGGAAITQPQRGGDEMDVARRYGAVA